MQLTHSFCKATGINLCACKVISRFQAFTFKWVFLYRYPAVEEETSVKKNFEQVLAREKKAGKERLVLENQLKVESRERRRQVSHTVELYSLNKSS
jgi:hypothetical protein